MTTALHHNLETKTLSCKRHYSLNFPLSLFSDLEFRMWTVDNFIKKKKKKKNNTRWFRFEAGVQYIFLPISDIKITRHFRSWFLCEVLRDAKGLYTSPLKYLNINIIKACNCRKEAWAESRHQARVLDGRGTRLVAPLCTKRWTMY